MADSSRGELIRNAVLFLNDPKVRAELWRRWWAA
jgi:hypothetical protein